jgi:hypothetical protein
LHRGYVSPISDQVLLLKRYPTQRGMGH